MWPNRLEKATSVPAGAREPAGVHGAVWFFAGLGIAIRLVRYLMDYPIWHDEAFLAVNFWDRGYVDLLRPLDYGQVAPWLFLAIERTAVGALGYSEQALRLFPTLCSLASVILFRAVARLVLPGRAQVLAMAIFATSVYPIRHGAEIKPYASDLLAALLLLYLALRWIRRPGQARWWWGLAGLTPVLIPLSYPSVFVAGGIGLAPGLLALRSRRTSVRLGCAIYGVMLVASFLASYAGAASFQAEAMRDEYRSGCWAESFPPLDRPWMIPIWLLDIHAGTMMAYPAGDRHGGSALTLLCVIAGGLALMRARRRRAALLMAPFGMGLVAAFLGRYPYGGAPRIVLYLAPSICLLAGMGLASGLSRLRPAGGRRAWLLATGGLAILGVGIMARDLACPYRVEGDLRTREFARWLWSIQDRETKVACLKSDFGLSFFPRQWSVGMSAVYLHHQHRFSDRHRNRQPLDLGRIEARGRQRLRLIAFNRLPEDAPAFRQWLRSLCRDFELRRVELFEVRPAKPHEDWLHDACVILELESRPDALARRDSAGRTGR